MKSKFLQNFLRGELPDKQLEYVKIGFWSESGEEIPIEPEWKNRNIQTLKSVINYLQDWDTSVAFNGQSTCRICKLPNGSAEHNKDGFTYPSGYLHYLWDHSVVPDARIIDAAKESGY